MKHRKDLIIKLRDHSSYETNIASINLFNKINALKFYFPNSQSNSSTICLTMVLSS